MAVAVDAAVFSAGPYPVCLYDRNAVAAAVAWVTAQGGGTVRVALAPERYGYTLEEIAKLREGGVDLVHAQEVGEV